MANISDEEPGIELSERDLDLKKSGLEGLAVLEILIEAEDEQNEAKWIERLKELSSQVLENGVKDVESLPFYKEKMGRDGLAKLLKLNPQYLCEYIAGLFRVVATYYLDRKPMNMKDAEFDLADKRSTAEFEDSKISPINPKDMSDKHKSAFATRMMVDSAIEYLLEEGLITDDEFNNIKTNLKP